MLLCVALGLSSAHAVSLCPGLDAFLASWLYVRLLCLFCAGSVPALFTLSVSVLSWLLCLLCSVCARLRCLLLLCASDVRRCSAIASPLPRAGCYRIQSLVRFAPHYIMWL